MPNAAASRYAALRPDTPDVWKREAACRNMEPNIFFPVGLSDADTPMALMTCRGCPVRFECLDYALSIPSLDGIWAGTNIRERDRIRARRRRLLQSLPAAALRVD